MAVQTSAEAGFFREATHSQVLRSSYGRNGVGLMLLVCYSSLLFVVEIYRPGVVDFFVTPVVARLHRKSVNPGRSLRVPAQSRSGAKPLDHGTTDPCPATKWKQNFDRDCLDD
jgi:hypothetical protein